MVIPDAPSSTETEETPSFLAVKDLDPVLALVGLRIEIERRLQTLAEQSDVQLRGGPRVLANELGKRGIIPPDVATALNDILAAGNAAAHGAEVPAEVRDFSFTEGPRIIAWLDSLASNS